MKRILLTLGLAAAALLPFAGCSRTLRTAEPDRLMVDNREAIDIMAEGARLEKEGNYRLALEKYEKALVLAPRPQLFYKVGACHFALGDHVQAQENLTRAVNLAGDYPAAQYLLSKVRIARALAEQRGEKAPITTAQLIPTTTTILVPEVTREKPLEVAMAQPRPGSSKSAAPGVAARIAPKPSEEPAPEPAPLPEAIPVSEPQPEPAPLPEPAAEPTLDINALAAAPSTRVEPPAAPEPAPKPAPELPAAVTSAIPNPQSPIPNARPEIPAPLPRKEVAAAKTRPPAATELPPPLPNEALFNPKEPPRVVPTTGTSTLTPVLGQPDFHWAQARSFLQRNMLEDAMHELLLVLRANERHLEARLELADLYDKMNRGERALEELQMAIVDFPNEAKVFFRMGNYYLRHGLKGEGQGMFDNSARAYYKALRLNPKYHFAYNNLGLVYMQLGQYDAARKAFDAALKIAPDYMPAHRNLGMLYEQHLNDPKAALYHYQQYVNSGPDDAEEVREWMRALEKGK